MHHSITSMISKEVNEVRGSLYRREANSKAFLCQLPPGMRKLPGQGNMHVVTQRADFVHHMTNVKIKDYIIGISKM